MWTAQACEALREGLALELRYDGFHRLVEAHAVDYTKDGNAIMRRLASRRRKPSSPMSPLKPPGEATKLISHGGADGSEGTSMA